MVVVPVLSLLSAIFFYVQALKNAMGAKRWGVAGLLMGPFVYPMFRSHQRLKEFKASQQDSQRSAVFRA